MYIVETYLQDQIKELHFPIKKKKKKISQSFYESSRLH